MVVNHPENMIAKVENSKPPFANAFGVNMTQTPTYPLISAM
jgi:hypothetical protein